jgi:hypothetical protein
VKRLIIGVALIGLAAALAPALSVAAGGATHDTQTFIEQTDWFGPDACSGVTITGQGVQTVTVSETTTSNGSVHDRVDVSGSVDLYQANGPGPWDPQPGRFIGTWTYTGHTSDQAPPNEAGATTGVTAGMLVYPDGTAARRQVMFHVTWAADGPPKLFFAKFTCAGN